VTLHPFQLELVERTAATFARGAKSVVLQAGTGSGKTHTASEILRRRLARKPGSRALFLADLDSILEDTVTRLRAAGLHVGLHQADRPADPTASIQVASLQTLRARGDRPPADFLVLDECQNSRAASVEATVRDYPGAILLGLTATPQRGDGQPLGDVFQAMVCGPSNEWLTANGYLVPCDLVAPMRATAGLACNPVDAYEEWGHGPAIVFLQSVAHAERLAAEFRSINYGAECVTAKTPHSVRRGLRERIARGETKIVTGVDLFTRAWDSPPIETVIFARRFSVVGPWLQALGRGSRVSPATGKSRCTAIDLCGSWVGLGLRDDPREWSLTGVAVSPRSQLPAVRRCAECAAVFPPATVCPRCGAHAERAERIVRVLSRAEKLAIVSRLPRHEQDARYLKSLVRVATQRMGMEFDRAYAWAVNKFRAQRGRAPEVAA
jgi:superfamily II DNA or RNA helicase